MSWTEAKMKVANDAARDGITHVQWSSDGASETDRVARTAKTVNPATAANPSVVSSDGALESAACSGGEAVTITHFAFAGGEEGADRFTEWIELDDSRTLNVGDKITAADEALKVKLYQATEAPGA